eukprot:6892958-Pyramimonas_sp.AAC.1
MVLGVILTVQRDGEVRHTGVGGWRAAEYRVGGRVVRCGHHDPVEPACRDACTVRSSGHHLQPFGLQQRTDKGSTLYG